MTDGPLALPRDRIKHDLFPPIEPFETGFLEIEGETVTHRLYWEQSGNPDGAPVIFLHGGPGAGASPNHRRFFDPEHYRIIIMDQRGAGRSRPLGELRENDPDHLISDLEAVRKHLGINRWHVFGGSWGSTLALIYAQAHPDQVVSLVLRGIFLMTRPEIDWFLYGMQAIFPDHWSDFASFIPEDERDNLLDAYYKRLTDTNRDVWLPAARSWSRYESVCSTLLPTDDGAVSLIDETHALGLSRIEAHFFRHHLFKPERRILEDIDRIRHIPTHIIQGRYDIVCPPSAAFELHRHWPEASFLIVPDAGHSAMEPGIRAALVAGTQAFKNIEI
ncbi:MAG: prolyl aminopeptidase [Alphaproteobacteria bacterium]|nr:prolyl aminopeptidase [Alphaproteobacteria bacterium SS10]